ncbi:transglycosylase SLT domain-containing protein [Roseovarius sp. B08]|uniref:transglycosylase SLT domain-containing protein n=1 Tax=Roseovarius sp. B08 TaxID=3449223 RepID=UPI003EDBB815
MLRIAAIVICLCFQSLAAAEEDGVVLRDGVVTRVSPPARDGNVPRTRWEHVGESRLWTRAALAALKDHGKPLTDIVPHDIDEWCPAYPDASPAQRRAFWVGFLSALVKHESTYRSYAVGGGGRWYGLTQILPSTARLYGCRARSGGELKHGPTNLSCAIRIMAKTVKRDGVVSRGMRGVAADWGPLHSSSKRQDMMAWIRRQTYCRPMSSVRPRLRPADLVVVRTLPEPEPEAVGTEPVVQDLPEVVGSAAAPAKEVPAAADAAPEPEPIPVSE